MDPALVPELLISDLERSLAFWVDDCGFTVRNARPAEGFAHLAMGGAQVMLDQRGIGRDWVTGPLDAPLGRGMNLQISVPDAEALAERLTARSIALFLPVEHRWYRVGDEEAGVAQFLVQDPDGYLLRFQSARARRPAADAPGSSS